MCFQSEDLRLIEFNDLSNEKVNQTENGKDQKEGDAKYLGGEDAEGWLRWCPNDKRQKYMSAAESGVIVHVSFPDSARETFDGQSGIFLIQRVFRVSLVYIPVSDRLRAVRTRT